MNKKKIVNGQFFTTGKTWLMPQIIEFIKKSKCKIVYDPFAGAGDLIKTVKELGNYESKGLDKDQDLGWDYNDSLLNIPHVDDALIVTNPPYLSNYSASRKHIYDEVAIYFDNSSYDDIYLIALDKMLEAQKNVIAIIPETFINSNYKNKKLLSSISVLEKNPFNDTDVPVCVVCFDGVEKPYKNVKVFKNDKFVMDLGSLESQRLHVHHNIEIKFNVLSAWLALRAVDTTNPNKRIEFGFKENFDYNWSNGIKVSSRLLTVMDIDIPVKDRKKFISICNKKLEEYRSSCSDLLLSPFKGNNKLGIRRRRLDFYTARAILEDAYNDYQKN